MQYLMKESRGLLVPRPQMSYGSMQKGQKICRAHMDKYFWYVWRVDKSCTENDLISY